MKRNNRKVITGALVSAFVVGALLVVPTVNAATQDTTINSTVGSVLSVFTATPSPVDVSVTPTSAGAQSIASSTVTVGTNGPGYTLQISDKDTNTNLVSGANNIAATSGTYASPAALTPGTWGYRVDGVGTFGAGPTSAVSSGALSPLLFAGVPSSASPQSIRNTSTSTTGDSTVFWYSVAANTAQAAGTYSDVVTYTAVAK